MSQENLSGGLLVLIFSLGLYGPVCGQPLASLARFAGLFLASGAATFGAADRGHDRRRPYSRRPSSGQCPVGAGDGRRVQFGLVGQCRTDIDLRDRARLVGGSPQDRRRGAPVLQTYGFAVLLMVVIGLLAGYLGRSWQAASGDQRQFVWKFAGVTLGAYVLHLFALLRSDLSHLAGPSYLLPLFLLALPVFAWRCLRPGLGRGLLLLVSVALIAEAAIAGRSELVRHAAAAGNAWKRFDGGARRLSRPPRRRGPAARHRVPLFADPALPGGVPQRAVLRRAGGARGAAAATSCRDAPSS